MPNVQPQFDQFHSKIRLGRFEEEKTLREKRDIIRDRLRERLPGVFEKYGEPYIEPTYVDQGSYEMRTGVKPLNGDYDIDQGVYFMVSREGYPDPVTLKERVYEALEGHTDRVEIRRPCVTVFYLRDGVVLYHVDLAIYSDASCNSDSQDYLARGKEHSAVDQRIWEVSNPKALEAALFGKYGTEDGSKQFRRIVRFMKRWKDVQFNGLGNAAPRGIALTVAVQSFLALPIYLDPLTAASFDDLAALSRLVDTMLANFMYRVYDEEDEIWYDRIRVYLPVGPWTDLFARMTNRQMEAFRKKLEELRDALIAAADAVDPRAACTILQNVFGDDFPVPPEEETAKKLPRAIVSSSSSA
jgi:hypothetical protein